MVNHKFSALVVEDDAELRQLTICQLSQHGFQCDAAGDGLQARDLAAVKPYDVVVTDLRMPGMNGYTLAVELLGREHRPIVVIHTAVTEPRLARDLIARGVDDILFKPVDQSILAAKVRALVDRRALRIGAESPSVASPTTGPEAPNFPVANDSHSPRHVQASELEVKLTHLAKMVPISQVALDIMNMANSDTVNMQQLAATIELDASLVAELLRIANSTFYNPSDRRIVDLQESVVRIGQKRVGEIALMMSAMGAMTGGMLPWMDIALVWRRSVAAGLAAELLISQTKESRAESGLFLCAIMHPLGRVMLGALYPDRYQAMLPLCQDGRETLQECEQRVFQRSHTEILAQVLEIWHIPAAVIEPLRYVHCRAGGLFQLSDLLRAKVELTQLAILLGQIVAGHWEAWDVVHVPTITALRGNKLETPTQLVQQLRSEMQLIGQQAHLATAGLLHADQGDQAESCVPELDYFNLGGEPFDVLVEILPSMGVGVNMGNPADLSPDRPAVVNCYGLSQDRAVKFLTPGSKHVLVTNASDGAWLAQYGNTVILPQSYGTFRAACLQVATTRASAILENEAIAV